MTLVFDPLAKGSTRIASITTRPRRRGSAEKFRKAVWAAIAVLERFPDIGEEVRPGIRKILLRRFPYKLIYSVTDNYVYIIAVAHGHREPDYWSGRA